MWEEVSLIQATNNREIGVCKCRELKLLFSEWNAVRVAEDGQARGHLEKVLMHAVANSTGAPAWAIPKAFIAGILSTFPWPLFPCP